MTIEDVHIVDPSEWTGSGSGFNVTVSNGVEEYQLRIDADVLGLYEGTYPIGTFNVTGIGGQFDNSEPYTEGYQLFPRYVADIAPYDPFIEEFPLKTIGEVTQNNEDGTAVSDELKCELIGTTYGINARPSGLQFTIIDENNDGIGLFINTGNLNYNYTEGDIISVRGTISQFNGLTQIEPDSIALISSANELVEPTATQSLSEETESQLVTISNLKIVDPSQWSGDGSSFNIDLENGAGEILFMRIDSDTDLANTALPGDNITVTGIGGQFDSEAPYDDGYQLLPRYTSDIVVISNTDEWLLNEDLVNVYPNPTSIWIRIETDLSFDSIRMYDAFGRLIRSIPSTQQSINISGIPSGNYYLQLITKDGIVQKEVIKI